MRINEFQLTDLLIKMYDNSAEAIFFFDRVGKVIAMNNAAQQILDTEVLKRMAEGDPKAICMTCKGYTNEHELQTCMSCYLSNPTEDLSSFQVYLDTVGKGIIPYTASYQTIDKENGIRAFMLRDLTKQYRTQEMLNQRTMMKSIIKAQEDERKRISRELHDGVAQEILSSLVDIRVLKYMNIDDEVLKKVQQTEGSLMHLLDDIRHLSVELRPATLDDLGLEAAFRTHFKWIEKNYGLIVHFSAELQSKRYEGEIETVVYRVCQEAVFNALKYAGTDDINVRLFEEQGFLELLVKDEGVGFDVNHNQPIGTGLGLYGMKERAELVDGQLETRSLIGEGTSITLKIPLLHSSSEGGPGVENHNRG
ncbi:sensor histidine kinase [Filibacter tadaridae]|nr:ATP-binding protein [Filibacter tadaridae]